MSPDNVVTSTDDVALRADTVPKFIVAVAVGMARIYSLKILFAPLSNAIVTACDAAGVNGRPVAVSM